MPPGMLAYPMAIVLILPRSYLPYAEILHSLFEGKQMPKTTMLRSWAREVGVSATGLARLLDVSVWTVYSWRRDDVAACEPADWRARLILGLEREVAQLRARDSAERGGDRSRASRRDRAARAGRAEPTARP